METVVKRIPCALILYMSNFNRIKMKRIVEDSNAGTSSFFAHQIGKEVPLDMQSDR